MRNRLVRAVLLVVLGIAVVLPVAGFSSRSATTDETTTITDYVADFTVASNGDLHAVETISVDFPDGYSKHGIFRFFDTHDPTAPHARRIPRDISVTQDGLAAQTALSWEKDRRYRVVKIGDPSAYVSQGTHVYRISYDIDGVLEKGTDGSPTQFDWQLIPGGWAQRIQKSDLTVALPAPAQKIECVAGVGVTTGCTPSGLHSATLHLATGPLAPDTPVTVRVGMDLPTPAAGDTLPWTGRWDAVLGHSVLDLLVVGVLAVLAALLGAIGSRETHEDDPGFPLQYAPPEGVGPAQAQYVRTETTSRDAYVGSVMQAAEKGAVTLSHEADGSWTITDTGAGWAGLDEVTERIYRLIGTPRGSFTASRKSVSEGERLKEEIAGFDGAIRQWAMSNGFVARSGIRGGGALVVLAGLATVALVIWNPFSMSVTALIPGLFAIAGGAMVATGASTKRTAKGRDLWSRVGGFHRVLSTPSSQARFDFSGRQELYTQYLPWAVAFGCADAWAAKYETEVGSAPPVPSYFGAYAGASLGNAVGSMVDSFSSTVDSAISSYDATQHSSSGGGGFSGGGFGGGGGGGGSW